ncbi:serine O-acetyltransferase [Roseateles albus]|uniref:Serine acetyltransferase n=1 Tax=Roseateles albus TaxID=2987525 RepID=A0ABT5KGJ6_9BURK|nr:serine acetyltransferase [Roseateles albus]MDC8772080.1 serine acetyltransferase [Roseateles albus]
MDWREYSHCVKADAFRISGSYSFLSVAKLLLLGESYKYIFWFRTAALFRSKFILKVTFFPLCYLVLRHYKYRFGISIPLSTKIGVGFYVGHFGGIVINGACKIGDNFNISQGVTLGSISFGDKKGCPTIGNDVYIGPGAKVIGSAAIGDGVAIGANAVVTGDVVSGATVAGVPARILSMKGSKGYVNRTNYPPQKK